MKMGCEIYTEILLFVPVAQKWLHFSAAYSF